ncbi:MAG: glycosyltransferase family 4 protein [Cyanobacteria bacterium P01_H01_bin.15]
MKILVLAWEFPPRIIGGIARHVAELYPEIVNLGHSVHLLTPETEGAPGYEQVEGIYIYRVPVEPATDFLHWVSNLNVSLGRMGGKLLQELSFDLIHAHDWLVGDAAIALKHHFKVPLIATIHATEYGRNNGLHSPTQHFIHGREKNLVYEAWRVIVCTQYMRQEAERALHVPWNKIEVIYNGIRPGKKVPLPSLEKPIFRRQFARDEEKIVYYVGRIAHQKGVFVLLNAAPRVLHQMGEQVQFVIIGGGSTDHLQTQAWNLGISHQCTFTGFMSEPDLDKFQTVADCAVFPSLYEPFGIVALESFAAQVPVVVSDTCGLPEVVRHGQTGITTYTNNPESLAWGITTILQNPNYAQTLVRNAYLDLQTRFRWSDLAQQTTSVYTRVTQERSQVHW